MKHYWTLNHDSNLTSALNPVFHNSDWSSNKYTWLIRTIALLHFLWLQVIWFTVFPLRSVWAASWKLPCSESLGQWEESEKKNTNHCPPCKFERRQLNHWNLSIQATLLQIILPCLGSRWLRRWLCRQQRSTFNEGWRTGFAVVAGIDNFMIN